MTGEKEKKDTYELMKILHGEPNPPWSDGIDSDPVEHNDGLGIIRWLLKHDPFVKKWKLIRKPGSKRKQYTMRFTPKAADVLEEMAKEEGVSVSEFIRRAINFYQVKTEATKCNKLIMLQSVDGSLEIVPL
ncbi:MAG: CopG family transcriptional regulator [candidate division Zixibacteria bacterium]|nr:CopG family transcriptional regulator [candidate division Zixibacteria bacterium]